MSIARSAVEGYCLEAQSTILFLLRSPIPVESDTVVAGLALSLAIDAVGLLFAALDFATFAGPATISRPLLHLFAILLRLLWSRHGTAIDRRRYRGCATSMIAQKTFRTSVERV